MIRKINGQKEDFSVISAFTCDAKEIANSFGLCRFKWVDRSANQVAHVVVRNGLRMNVDCFWVREVLDWAAKAVDDDRRHVESP